ncbi:MAG TPA: type II toxin-antitoxin system VapC family toxin [Reyranella sp.]|jgi:ribonuclease VapC|nr:type II toxin-antitoxin system VapC family toxin [Reyranella sp.]
MTDIAIDTSAIVEVLTRGPQASSLRATMDAAATVFATSVTRVEAAFVLVGRFGLERSAFDRAWETLGVEEVAVDAALATLAIDAFQAWGKGRAKSSLNFGDCFSYALAVVRSMPLLFIGEDFSQTDVQRA